MMKAGMDAVRINFSHGNHKEHVERIETVRLLNKKYRRGIKILADLEGARIRVGRLGGRGQMFLEKNKTVYMSAGGPAAGDKYIPFD